jgi:peptidylprolyl isomerase
VLAVLLLLVGAVACTSDEPDGASDDDPEIAVDLDAAPDASDLLSDDRGDPPDELVAQDLVVGDGEPAVEGAELTVQYLGVRWSDAGEFDSSWASGQPLRFELGAAQVIPGWERGVAGEGLDVDAMRVGGRRSLVIPPDLAYGDRGAGGVIGPDETLVFVVDLVDVDTAP